MSCKNIPLDASHLEDNVLALLLDLMEDSSMKIEKLASLSVKMPWWFKVFLLLAVVALAIVAASTSKGQEVPSTSPSAMVVGLPPTSDPTSSATLLPESLVVGGGRPQKATVVTPVDVQIDIVPFLGPELSNPESGVVIARLIEDYLAGDLKPGRGYIILYKGRIDWTDLVMGAGFDTLKQLIVARSNGDNISLNQVVIKATSLPGGVLSGTYSVPSGYGYGPNAVGIKSDETRVTSGDGGQGVERIAFVTQLPQFIGGETEAGQNAVRDWVKSNGMFITYEVMIRGNEASKRYATVSTGPWVKIDRTKQDTLEVVVESGDGFLYNLYTSPTVNGPWTRLTKGVGVLRWPLHPTQPMQYFKARRAP